jgi:hypothetical protein
MHPVLREELERYRRILDEVRRDEWRTYMKLRIR